MPSLESLWRIALQSWLLGLCLIVVGIGTFWTSVRAFREWGLRHPRDIPAILAAAIGGVLIVAFGAYIVQLARSGH